MNPPINQDPDQSEKISNYDKFINYVSTGAEIGKTALSAESQDSRMRKLVEAPNRGNLSAGAKAVNLVYLGFIAMPALAGYKVTDKLIKYFDKSIRDRDQATQAKKGLQQELNVLTGRELDLRAQISQQERNGGQDGVQLEEELKKVIAESDNKYAQLDLADTTLNTPPLVRAKEKLLAQREVIEAKLNEEGIGEAKPVFEKILRQLTDAFIKEQDDAIRDYNRVLELRRLDESSSARLTIDEGDLTDKELEDIREDNRLEEGAKDLTDADIENFIAEHEAAKTELALISNNTTTQELLKDENEINSLKDRLKSAQKEYDIHMKKDQFKLPENERYSFIVLGNDLEQRLETLNSSLETAQQLFDSKLESLGIESKRPYYEMKLETLRKEIAEDRERVGLNKQIINSSYDKNNPIVQSAQKQQVKLQEKINTAQLQEVNIARILNPKISIKYNEGDDLSKIINAALIKIEEAKEKCNRNFEAVAWADKDSEATLLNELEISSQLLNDNVSALNEFFVENISTVKKESDRKILDEEYKKFLDMNLQHREKSI